MKVVLQDFKYGRIMRPGGDYYIGDSIALYGEYCEAEIDIYRQCVHKDDYVLDIGANIGACTIPLAQMVGANGRVYAFEPQRVIFQMLCGNVMLNNLMNVYTQNVAIGRNRSKIKINDKYLDPTISHTNTGSFEIEKNPGDYEIEIISIDDLQLPKCDFIKCDTEGMGTDVLYGAENTIRKFLPTIYIEREYDDKGKSIVDFLHKLKYKIYKHDPTLYNDSNFFNDVYDAYLTYTDYPNVNYYVNYNWLCVPETFEKSVQGFDLEE